MEILIVVAVVALFLGAPWWLRTKRAQRATRAERVARARAARGRSRGAR